MWDYALKKAIEVQGNDSFGQAILTWSAFLEGWVGKIVFTATFAFLLALFGNKFWPELALAVFLINILPRWRPALLICFGVVGWLTRGIDWEIVERVAHYYRFSLYIPFYIWKCLLLGLVIVTCTSYLYFQAKVKIAKDWPVGSLVIFLSVSFFIIYIFVGKGNVTLFFWFYWVVLTKFAWFVAYSSVELKSRDLKSCLLRVGEMYPFWVVGSLPIPDTSDYSARIQGLNSKELMVSQYSGIKLMAWLLTFKVVSQGLAYFLYGTRFGFMASWTLPHLNLPPLLSVGFGPANKMHLSLLFRWVDCLGSALLYFVDVGLFFGIMVATARMIGLNCPSYINAPWKAKNFNDFLARMVHYYSRLILRLFVIPTFRRLRFISNFNLRLFLSIFLAIMIAGPFSHLFAFPPQLLTNGPREALKKIIMMLPYFVLISTFSGLAAISERKWNWPKRIPLVRKMIPLFYFSVFGVIVVMAGTYILNFGFEDSWKFLFSLFGVNHV